MEHSELAFFSNLEVARLQGMLNVVAAAPTLAKRSTFLQELGLIQHTQLLAQLARVHRSLFCYALSLDLRLLEVSMEDDAEIDPSHEGAMGLLREWVEWQPPRFERLQTTIRKDEADALLGIALMPANDLDGYAQVVRHVTGCRAEAAFGLRAGDVLLSVNEMPSHFVYKLRDGFGEFNVTYCRLQPGELERAASDWEGDDASSSGAMERFLKGWSEAWGFEYDQNLVRV